MTDYRKSYNDLLNGVIFNDLGGPLTQISRARHYSTFNNIISNIANNVPMLFLKTKRPSTLTGRNVRFSHLLISASYPYSDTVRSTHMLSGIVPPRCRYCAHIVANGADTYARIISYLNFTQDRENRLQSQWKFPLGVVVENADNADNADTSKN